jgi:hypothetical protein
MGKPRLPTTGARRDAHREFSGKDIEDPAPEGPSNGWEAENGGGRRLREPIDAPLTPIDAPLTPIDAVLI